VNPLARWVGLPAGVAVATGVASLLGWLSADVAAQVGAMGLVGVLGGVAVASARPELQVFGVCLTRAVHPGRAALTFDDGPDPDSTPRLLQILAKHGATATFFVLADRAERHPDLVRAMVLGGHEVALHGRAHHPWLTMWSAARGERDLREALGILGRLGVRTSWFRPAFGAVSPRVFASMRAAGLQMAWCSVRTGDGGWISRETLLERCRRVVGTDIVLMHEGARLAREVLDEVLEEWASRAIRATSLAHALEPG